MAVTLESALRVATLNVRGLAARRRQYQLSRLLLENDIDIIAIQETKVESDEQTDRMVEPFRARFNVCVCHSVGFSGGCALLLRNTIGIVEEKVFVGEMGRLVGCDFSFSGRQWRVICVYAPNKEGERRVFFERIEGLLNCQRLVILLGDFNCVCTAEDRVQNLPVRDQRALFLNNMVQELNLEDVGGIFSTGYFPRFTHFQRQSHARLDRSYVSASLVPLCREYDVEHVSFSDHSLVMFTLGVKQAKSRFNWKLWKFNDKLIKDETFMSGVKDGLEKLLAAEANFVRMWEQFKNEVKVNAIERSCIARYNEKQRERDMHNRLDYLLGVESAQPGSFTKEIREVKSQLELIDTEKYRGAMIRARAKRVWAGEIPTKRSLGEEKRYAKKK